MYCRHWWYWSQVWSWTYSYASWCKTCPWSKEESHRHLVIAFVWLALSRCLWTIALWLLLGHLCSVYLTHVLDVYLKWEVLSLGGRYKLCSWPIGHLLCRLCTCSAFHSFEALITCWELGVWASLLSCCCCLDIMAHFSSMVNIEKLEGTSNFDL